MVKDNFNAYYTRVFKTLAEIYPTIKGSTVYKATPPHFPYFYMKQIDGSLALTTLSGTEDGINLGLEFQFYSKVSLAEVRKIALIAKATLLEVGYQCDTFQQVDNAGDSSIYRWIMRVSKLETEQG